MATNHTEHYQLNLWEPTDYFLREEFNENTEKLDAAVGALARTVAEKGNCRIVAGSYTGSGTYGSDHPSTLEVADAERPPQVIIINETGGFYRAVLVRGMARYCVSASNGNGAFMELTWTDRGVRWYSSNHAIAQLNSSGSQYYYTVFI